MNPDEAAALAAEIKRRRLKFADVVANQYEMLSDDEHDAIAAALAPASPPAEALQAGVNALRQALHWYREQFCEHSAYFEGCGKLKADECAGCRAMAVLSSVPAQEDGA